MVGLGGLQVWSPPKPPQTMESPLEPLLHFLGEKMRKKGGRRKGEKEKIQFISGSTTAYVFSLSGTRLVLSRNHIVS